MNLLLRSNSCASCIKSSITNYFFSSKIEFFKIHHLFKIFSPHECDEQIEIANSRSDSWVNCLFWIFSNFTASSLWWIRSSRLINMWDFKGQWNELYEIDILLTLLTSRLQSTKRNLAFHYAHHQFNSDVGSIWS